MTLRIKTNAPSYGVHRQMVNNHRTQEKTLERLSSGLKINRGADAPANLQISERLRAQSAGLKQAIDNSEMGVSLVQTAEAALDEVSRTLINARQIAVHAANEGVNDEFMLESDQQEIDNIIESVNRVATNTSYGNNNLLDGSRAGNGVTQGDNLEFLVANHEAISSGLHGYEVSVTQAATRSEHVGAKQLTQAIIDEGEQITLTEGGRTLNFVTQAGRSVEQTLNDLGKAIGESEINVELLRPDPTVTGNDDPQFIRLRHTKFGSELNFTVASTTAGILSQKGDISDWIETGVDIKGEINGEAASGKAQVLTGGPGASGVEGIQIRYTGEAAPEGNFAGTVTFAQNSLIFHVGANADQTSAVSLRSMHAQKLGTGVTTESGFASFRKIDVTSARGAEDSIRIIDKAIEDVAVQRGELGAFQKNNLESNLNYLRIAHQEIMGSESVIRDADMAEEMMAFTRNQIMVESSTAMMAQANMMSQSVLQLLG